MNLANICLLSSQSHFDRVKISLELEIVSRSGPSCTNRGQFDLIASKNASSDLLIGSGFLLLYIQSKPCACFFYCRRRRSPSVRGDATRLMRKANPKAMQREPTTIKQTPRKLFLPPNQVVVVKIRDLVPSNFDTW